MAHINTSAIAASRDAFVGAASRQAVIIAVVAFCLLLAGASRTIQPHSPGLVGDSSLHYHSLAEVQDFPGSDGLRNAKNSTDLCFHPALYASDTGRTLLTRSNMGSNEPPGGNHTVTRARSAAAAGSPATSVIFG